MTQSLPLDRKTLGLACRVLGVHVTASKVEIKQARDRLARLYHPDKHAKAGTQAVQQTQEHFKNIQTAYDFLMQHHDLIQHNFQHMQNFALTNRALNRAQWVYTTVGQSSLGKV